MYTTDQIVSDCRQPLTPSLGTHPPPAGASRMPAGPRWDRFSIASTGGLMAKPPGGYLRFGLRAALDCIAMAGIVLLTAVITFLLGS